MERIQAQQNFGAYRIEQKLGKGSMASVFKAVHMESGQEVALKILHEQYSDDTSIRRRLEHEASIAARLVHPNIVPVWDFGECNHRPYLVMPYMEGGSFAEYFSTPRTIKTDVSLRALALLASAIDYAHHNGVIHRDIKLENILLGPKNVPAISDFGIAQSINTTRITITGQILGTPHYLAPENFDGINDPDYRADFYSFAVAAYLMFTGFFPFTGRDQVAIIVKHRDKPVPAPTLVKPELPKALDEIFDKALAKHPDDRFPSALEFVENLDSAFLDMPSVSTTIYLNEANPISSNYGLISRAAGKGGTPSNLITQALPSHSDSVPFVNPVNRKQEGRKLWPFVLLGLLIACAWLSAFGWSLNNFSAADDDTGIGNALIAPSILRRQKKRLLLLRQQAQSLLPHP